MSQKKIKLNCSKLNKTTLNYFSIRHISFYEFKKQWRKNFLKIHSENENKHFYWLTINASIPQHFVLNGVLEKDSTPYEFLLHSNFQIYFS